MRGSLRFAHQGLAARRPLAARASVCFASLRSALPARAEGRASTPLPTFPRAWSGSSPGPLRPWPWPLAHGPWAPDPWAPSPPGPWPLGTGWGSTTRLRRRVPLRGWCVRGPHAEGRNQAADRARTRRTAGAARSDPSGDASSGATSSREREPVLWPVLPQPSPPEASLREAERSEPAQQAPRAPQSRRQRSLRRSRGRGPTC